MAKYGLNQVTLIGNLGKDPEIRYTDQGIPVANLFLACTESYRDRDGNYQDRTDWINVTLWRSQAEIASRYCRRGSTICIEGRLKTSSFETTQGEKRTKTEVEGYRIVLLDSAPGNPGRSVNTQTEMNKPLVDTRKTMDDPNTLSGSDPHGSDDLPF